MDNDNHLAIMERMKNLFLSAKTGVIALTEKPTIDSLTASLALYFALNKININCTIASSSQELTQYKLPDIEKIKNDIQIEGDNLVVSFPYQDGDIDKIDYYIQNGLFNLVIIPRSGAPRVDSSQIKFSYQGGKFDWIIVIDSPTLEGLGALYSNNQQYFTGKEIINIDRHLINANFGTINLVNKTISSISELIFKLIQYLEIEIDKEIASLLYLGITSATNNFSSFSTNADTLEIAANLLRKGAIKRNVNSIMSKDFLDKAKVFNKPPSIKFNQKPIEQVEKEANPGKEEKKLPQEWLKPKIFKGGSLI